jgi:hypothetical protein
LVLTAEEDLVEHKDWMVVRKVAQDMVVQGKLIVPGKVAQGKVAQGKVAQGKVVVVPLFWLEIDRANLLELQYRLLRQLPGRGQRLGSRCPLP